MADGESTKSRDVDELLTEADDITDDADDSRQRTRQASEEPTLRERAGEVFAPRVFLTALVLTAVGVAVGGFVPLVGGLLGFVGVFLAAFALGVVGQDSHYPEAGVASALVAGGWSMLGSFTLVVVGPGLALVAASAAVGLVSGLLGHYFGRDLRDGLTREI